MVRRELLADFREHNLSVEERPAGRFGSDDAPFSQKGIPTVEIASVMSIFLSPSLPTTTNFPRPTGLGSPNELPPTVKTMGIVVVAAGSRVY